jgi:methylmalonyl-CoA mutase N-terminal domain/subunit
MIRAIETGFFRKEIADSAFAWQRAVDSGQKIIVGVNAFEEAEEPRLEIQRIDPGVEHEQIQKLGRARQLRNASNWRAALDQLRLAATQRRNLMPALIEAARARATVGEIMGVLADVFGRYAPGGA